MAERRGAMEARPWRKRETNAAGASAACPCARGGRVLRNRDDGKRVKQHEDHDLRASRPGGGECGAALRSPCARREAAWCGSAGQNEGHLACGGAVSDYLERSSSLRRNNGGRGTKSGGGSGTKPVRPGAARPRDGSDAATSATRAAGVCASEAGSLSRGRGSSTLSGPALKRAMKRKV